MCRVKLLVCISTVVLLGSKDGVSAEATKADAAETAEWGQIPLSPEEYSIQEVHKNEHADVVTYDKVLILLEPHFRVPIMHCQSVKDIMSVELGGVQACWLIRKKILWVCATTVPERASGLSTYQVHIIVLVRKEGCKELSRQPFMTFTKAGVDNAEETSVIFSGKGSHRIERCVKTSVSCRDYTSQYPLSVKYDDKHWWVQYCIEETTPYDLDGTRLKECYPKTVLDLSQPVDSSTPRPSFGLREVADFLVLLLAPRYGYVCQIESNPKTLPEETQSMLLELKVANPGIEQWPDLFRRITLPTSNRCLCEAFDTRWGLYSMFDFR